MQVRTHLIELSLREACTQCHYGGSSLAHVVGERVYERILWY